jgi:hypothetical protein
MARIELSTEELAQLLAALNVYEKRFEARDDDASNDLPVIIPHPASARDCEADDRRHG